MRTRTPLFSTRTAALLGLAALAALGMAAHPQAAQAQGTITSADGAFKVGIGAGGNLYDPGSDVGFRRTSDGYDPIEPGSPREEYSVSNGSTSGWVDPVYYGTSNISVVSSAIGTNSATVSTVFTGGLAIDQNYAFAADNVLAITTTLTNTTAASQNVIFERGVDWDIAPTMYAEAVNVPTYSGAVTAATHNGFEGPDPTASLYDAGAGAFGAGDNGATLKLGLGTIGAGGQTTFTIYQAISQTGQSYTDLTNEVKGLGATYAITGFSSDAHNTNSAVLGYALGNSATPAPEPSSVAAFAFTALGAAGLILKARKRRIVIA